MAKFVEADAGFFEDDSWSEGRRASPALRTVAVGDGATYAIGGDRYPYTVRKLWVDQRTKKVYRVDVTPDDFERTDKRGFSEHQEYSFQGKLAPSETYTLRANGRYVLQGRTKTGHGCLFLGGRSCYMDPSY
jgi:hypothetical protein